VLPPKASVGKIK